MNKKITVAFVAAFAAAFLTNAKAQEQEPEQSWKKPLPANLYQIGIHPIYHFVNGLRIDLDRRLSNQSDWLSLGLEGYWAFEGSETTIFPLMISSDIKSIQGIGATLSFKHFFGSRQRQILFVKAGVSGEYFDIRYNAWTFLKFQEDYLNFYEWTYDEVRHNFPKVGSHLLFGIQLPSRSRVFVDGAVGIGYSYSFYKQGLYLPDAYRVLYGLSRRGFYPTGEFRLGIRLGKM